MHAKNLDHLSTMGAATLSLPDPQAAVRAIEERAKRLNLSLSALCAKAGVQAGTVLRWRAGTNSPGLSMYGATLHALELALAAERYRLKLETLDAQEPKQGRAA